MLFEKKVVRQMTFLKLKEKKIKNVITIMRHENRTICIIGGDTINRPKLHPSRCPNYCPMLPKLQLSDPDNVTYTLMADVEKHEI